MTTEILYGFLLGVFITLSILALYGALYAWGRDGYKLTKKPMSVERKRLLRQIKNSIVRDE